MHRIPEYIVLFAGLILLQVFLLDNVNLGVYVHPLAYVALVVLLPMELRSGWVLLTGLAVGVSVDFLTAGAGLHTIATLATAYARRPLMMLMLGKETVGDGGVPCSARVGAGKFVRYCSVVVFVHCVVFFIFEAFGLGWLHLTFVKILASAVITVLSIYVIQLLFRR